MKKEIKIQPRIQVEIVLFSGAKIGTMTILTDFDVLKNGTQNYIERVLRDSIQKCIDRLFVEGAYAIVKRESKQSL